MTRSSGAPPVRMCIGCRGRAEKAALLRLVGSGPGVVVDHSQTEPGRGAYLHRRAGCVTAAVRRRSLARALRLDGVAALDLEQVTTGLLEPEGAVQ